MHHMSNDRIDTIVFYDSRIFVIEYKYNKSSEQALDQIDKKCYDDAVVMESKLQVLLTIGHQSDEERI